jgi:hypothetical protein
MCFQSQLWLTYLFCVDIQAPLWSTLYLTALMNSGLPQFWKKRQHETYQYLTPSYRLSGRTINIKGTGNYKLPVFWDMSYRSTVSVQPAAFTFSFISWRCHFPKDKFSSPPQSKSLVSNNRDYSSFPFHLCTKIFHISLSCKNNKPYLPYTISKVPKLLLFCLLSCPKGANSSFLRLLYHLYVSACLYVSQCMCVFVYVPPIF